MAELRVKAEIIPFDNYTANDIMQVLLKYGEVIRCAADKPKPSKPKTNDKITYAEFVTMTEAEYEKLVDKHGKERVGRMIAILNNYKGSRGVSYKSDYMTILNWVVNRELKDNPPAKPMTEFERVNQPKGPKKDCPRCKGVGKYESKLPLTDIEQEGGFEARTVWKACKCEDVKDNASEMGQR